MKRDLISITDFTKDDVLKIFNISKKIKRNIGRKSIKTALKNKTLVMIFEKPSLRTRLSFEVGMTQLGGHAVYLGPKDIWLGERESVYDVSRVISRMGDIIMARTFDHKTITDLGRYSSIPVINALSDLEHPCQVMADIFTIWERRNLKNLKITYVGNAKNNVTNSLCLMCAMLGIDFRSVSPKGFKIDKRIFNKACEISKISKSQVKEFSIIRDALKDTDVVVTDTWTSMGEESDEIKRIEIFRDFQVNKQLMNMANKDAVFMHCLPAHRGREVIDEVIDGPQSVVFDEAENRLHIQKGILLFLLNKYD